MLGDQAEGGMGYRPSKACSETRGSVLSLAILPSVTGPQCKGAKGCGLRDGLPPGGGPEAFEFVPPTRKAPEKLGPGTLVKNTHLL